MLGNHLNEQLSGAGEIILRANSAGQLQDPMPEFIRHRTWLSNNKTMPLQDGEQPRSRGFMYTEFCGDLGDGRALQAIEDP